MKKIISFVAILTVLSVAVAYYSSDDTKPINLPKMSTPALTKEVQVQHPGWSGVIVPLKDGRAQRKGHSDAGKIQDVTADSFAIAWDKWDIEYYKKNPKTGVYHLYDRKPKPVQPTKPEPAK